MSQFNLASNRAAKRKVTMLMQCAGCPPGEDNKFKRCRDIGGAWLCEKCQQEHAKLTRG